MVCVKEIQRKKRNKSIFAWVGVAAGTMVSLYTILYWTGAFAYGASVKIKDIEDAKTGQKEIRQELKDMKAELKELSTISNKTAQDVAMIKGYILRPESKQFTLSGITLTNNHKEN